MTRGLRARIAGWADENSRSPRSWLYQTRFWGLRTVGSRFTRNEQPGAPGCSSAPFAQLVTNPDPSNPKPARRKALPFTRSSTRRSVPRCTPDGPLHALLSPRMRTNSGQRRPSESCQTMSTRRDTSRGKRTVPRSNSPSPRRMESVTTLSLPNRVTRSAWVKLGASQSGAQLNARRWPAARSPKMANRNANANLARYKRSVVDALADAEAKRRYYENAAPSRRSRPHNERHPLAEALDDGVGPSTRNHKDETLERTGQAVWFNAPQDEQIGRAHV